MYSSIPKSGRALVISTPLRALVAAGRLHAPPHCVGHVTQKGDERVAAEERELEPATAQCTGRLDSVLTTPFFNSVVMREHDSLFS